ncbi:MULTISPECIES: Fur family transcriptional regulator [Salimicrobium]|uniref:Fur family transcriptional regulator n=3 Tax=Salimicrobium TaxID=351195 RepID=K2FNP1_9BACI|nr:MULTISPECIES: Fur family transcriptional regulator [Salimicrobium]AKG05119.1 transcriptional repressor [Salimicrobium jeotgali]EKE32511.1 Fur family transcriptional regulator [Salimicrobium jeotgali]MBM7695506.1 Fur family zinc uptake transcriptional regulator [Salimicrobium jeotgali]PBB04716.1 transcriptional repressor [Salimicrobium humidisoli]SDY15052.1 Fur family transcriptional regulator, zinc uptake regulator [Salimicrobium album]
MSVMNRALQQLKEKGYKKTKQRERIIEIFASHDQYVPAKKILQDMQKEFPNISFDTVYRNLYLLSGENVLEATELEGEKHFRLSCGTGHHHHHFICTDCGKTKLIEFCPMEKINEDLKGYDVESHKFEIYGKCPLCA